MIKKSILFIVILFCMSGCSAVVNINIDKDSVSEEYLISGNSSDYKTIKENVSYSLPLSYDAEVENPFSGNTTKEAGIDYYDITTDDTNKKATIRGNFTLNNHTKSNVIRNCFKYYNILGGENSDEMVFSTSNGLTCEFNNFTLNIKTPYKVVASNANKVDEQNNIYTWQSNNKNSKEFGVNLTIDFSQKYNETNKSDNQENKNEQQNTKNTNNSFIWIIILIIIIITIIAFIILKNKERKVSEI